MLVFDANSGGAPAVHVLCIGVGDYFFMPRPGKVMPPETVGKFHPETPIMNRLTSPQPSARAVADWFIANQDRLEAPLGTVQLLIGSDPTGQISSGATLAEVKAAAKKWWDLCNQNADNVAIFYFCGHGVSDPNTSQSILLLQDFGDINEEFWRNAVNFEHFKLSMGSNEAMTQVFLLDACRNVPKSYMDIPRQGLSTLLTGRPLMISGKNVPVIRAATLNQTAEGTVNDQSRFCSVLIDCLNHYAATEVGNRWQVTVDSLGSAVKAVGNPRPRQKLPAIFEVGGETVSDQSLLTVKEPKAFAKVFFAPDSLGPLAGIEAKGLGRFSGDQEPVTFSVPVGPVELQRPGDPDWRTCHAKPPLLVLEEF
ncbi:hypothetical protein MCEMSE15_00537 [Fimbriimonadaceae bacterium]